MAVKSAKNTVAREITLPGKPNKTVRLREKNQITIPQDVISKLGFHVGEPLEVVVTQKGVMLKAYRPRPSVADEEWLTDEIVAEIEAAAAEKPGKGFASADDMIASLRG